MNRNVVPVRTQPATMAVPHGNVLATMFEKLLS